MSALRQSNIPNKPKLIISNNKKCHMCGIFSGHHPECRHGKALAAKEKSDAEWEEWRKSRPPIETNYDTYKTIDPKTGIEVDMREGEEYIYDRRFGWYCS